MANRMSNETQADRSAETKGRILEAALNEFAALGLAGARTEHIATAAGVNKALLYYYFESKEKLYTKALETAALKEHDKTLEVFKRDATPGERVLRLALGHFDRILTQRAFQRLMQQEMLRLRRGESGELQSLVKNIFAPHMSMFESIIREGIQSGELIDVEWLQILLASHGANVLYFLSSPLWRQILPYEPLDSDALRARRIAMVEFLGQAIFQDRKHGKELASKVLADTPMPEHTDFTKKLR
jgi:TetR/AcrR family transcriptional regulator